MTEDDTSRRTSTDTTTDDAETNAAASLSTYKINGSLADTNGIGVIGNSTATSSVTYGVLGMGDSPSVQGVVGTAIEGSLPSVPTSFPAGVWGVTDRSSTEGDVSAAYGVYGEATAESGVAYGVYSAGDSYTTGDHTVDGTVSAGKVGLSASLRSTAVSVPSDSETRVPFDHAIRDDFGGLDTDGTVGEYTIQKNGDYHVETAVNWADPLSGGTDHHLRVKVDGVLKAARIQTLPGGTSESAFIQEHVGKTLYGLSAGQKLVVTVTHNEGSDRGIVTGEARTYLTIDKVG